MPAEGMVDALRRAQRIVRPDGCVVDVHPTAAASKVEVGTVVVGSVDAPDARDRHAAAARADAEAVDRHLFEIEHTCDFAFFTYGDSIGELRDYVFENWRDADIEPAVVARAERAQRAAPGAKPRIREEVRLTKLRPLLA